MFLTRVRAARARHPPAQLDANPALEPSHQGRPALTTASRGAFRSWRLWRHVVADGALGMFPIAGDTDAACGVLRLWWFQTGWVSLRLRVEPMTWC